MMMTVAALDKQIPNDQGWRSRIMRALVGFHYSYYHRFTYKNRTAWTVSIEQLAHLPKQSVGYQLGRFMQQNDFDLLPKFESHDLFHVLLGYGLTVADEVRMQCCLAGSGRRTFSTWITIVIGTVFYPEHWRSFYAAYRRGSGLCDFSAWRFEPMLGMALSELRGLINKQKPPCS